jgi:PEGA domain
MHLKKIVLLVFGLFITGSLSFAPVLAGGRFFVGIGPGAFMSPGGVVFFASRRTNDRFFVEFGNRGAPLLFHGRGPSGYHYPPATSFPYTTAPGEVARGSFSGTDASGGLYVDGYRVMPSGWLRVQVEPADAQVLIDGFPARMDQLLGNTANLGLTVGSHSVEVNRVGFQTYRSEVEIKQAREVLLQIRLDQ